MEAMSAKPVRRLVQSLAIVAALGGIAVPSAVPGPALATRPSLPGVPAQSRSADLAAILERCAAYCDKLSRSVLDFVCEERVAETIAKILVTRPAVSGSSSRAIYFSRPWGSVDKRTRSKYLYDYQLVRTRSGEIKETRVLLEENGRKVEEKEASLKTRVFIYKYVVMGPVGLLGREEQENFDFSVVKETTLKKQRVVIIQAAPKSGAAGNVLYGKVWVRQSDAGILRIEWQPESMGNYEGIEEMARELGMKPRLSFVSEYDFEKNGLRFPSRYEIEEAYSSKVRAPLVRSKTEVTYDAYKFFTVETGVAIR
ncbi:MAG: hypothetical protein MUQ25_03670 [Candidatus Aminicenantes bacterium]|nr:hypothetical protein [Candidatus Aminicenantes bacterium]